MVASTDFIIASGMVTAACDRGCGGGGTDDLFFYASYGFVGFFLLFWLLIMVACYFENRKSIRA